MKNAATRILTLLIFMLHFSIRLNLNVSAPVVDDLGRPMVLSVCALVNDGGFKHNQVAAGEIHPESVYLGMQAVPHTDGVKILREMPA